MVTKEQIFEKILNSQVFSNGSIYRDLLSYLFKCYREHIIPKETVIAYEVFHKKSSFNPADDPIVRVHMYKLRKRLQQYYEAEGSHDSVRLQIPKGHYQIEFADKSAAIRKMILSRLILTGKYGGLALIFALFGFLLFHYLNNCRPVNVYEQTKVWGSFFKNDKPILIVMGDLYFFLEQSDRLGYKRVIRDYRINSETELDHYISGLEPDRISVEEYKYSYYSLDIPYAFAHLYKVLGDKKENIQMRRSSLLRTDDLLKYNIIFIGSVRTLGLLDHYFEKSNFSINLQPHQFLYYDPEADTTASYSFVEDESGFNRDYGLVAKFAGPADNTVMIFTGLQFTGVAGVVEYMTALKNMADMDARLDSDSGTYFETFFSVSGVEKTGFNASILKFNLISGTQNYW